MTLRGTDGAPVKAVHVLVTGTGAQHKEHRYGSRAPQLWWVLTSRSWIKIPITLFAIEHREGLVLFDTGMDPAICSDPNYINSALGRFLLKRIFQLQIGPDEGLANALKAAGLESADVKTAVISHLHFDHIGGIADIPQADLLVSAAEWQVLSTPHPEHEWMLREHIELPGAKWNPIEYSPTEDPLFAAFEGCFDVMDDGSMVLLPTPGHTPGSQSMLVRTEGLPPLLLIGDLTYEVDLLMNDQVPGTGEADQLRASFKKVRELKRQMPDLVILPSHDPAAARAAAL